MVVETVHCSTKVYPDKFSLRYAI